MLLRLSQVDMWLSIWGRLVGVARPIHPRGQPGQVLATLPKLVPNLVDIKVVLVVVGGLAEGPVDPVAVGVVFVQLNSVQVDRCPLTLTKK